MRSIPLVPRALGFAGALPFVSCAVGAALVPSHAAWFVHTGSLYGTTILSFMGAVHWPIAMQQERAALSVRDRQIAARRYAISVAPALLGFFAGLAPAPVALSTLGAAFPALLAYDYASLHLLPPWYWALRWRLTAIVVASLSGLLYVNQRETRRTQID